MTTTPIAFPEDNAADSLQDAFSQSHNALQWLARMVRSFRTVNSGDDVALLWDSERKAFATDDFLKGLKMELRFPELTLQFLENGKAVKHELRMEGHTPAQVEAWVLVELLHRGLDRGRFSKDLPYDIAHPMAGDNVEYSPDFREEELKKILACFNSASELLRSVAQQPSQSAALPLTLRTRDFSLEVQVPLMSQKAEGQSDPQIRVGFFPLRNGNVDPHYRVSRSELTSSAPDILEIIKISGLSPEEVAGPQMIARIKDAVSKLQKLASQ